MNGGKVATFFFSAKRKKNTKLAKNGTNTDLTIQIERK